MPYIQTDALHEIKKPNVYKLKKQGNKSEESGAAGLTFSNLDTVSG